MSASKRSRGVIVAALAIAGLVAATLHTGAGGDVPAPEVNDPDTVSIVILSIPDVETLDTVVSGGYDLDHDLERVGDGFEVTAGVTDADRAELERLGVSIALVATDTQIESARTSMMSERAASLASDDALATALSLEFIDTVVVARADSFTSTGDSEFLSVEAKSTDGQSVDLTVEWDAGAGTEIGDGGSAELGAFVDAGQYLYHRGEFRLNLESTLVIDDGPAAGSYTAVGTGFGPPLDTTGVGGTVQLARDGHRSPTDACDPLLGFAAGSIALVDRGSCSFTRKVANAQAAGAVAVIVADDRGAPPAMVGSDSSITIPSAMIAEVDGVSIKAGLPTTGTLQPLPPLPAPTRVRVTSSNGGTAEADVAEWIPSHGEEPEEPYFEGFLDHYPDAYELTEIIEQLHADFPDLTDIIELPYLTNGYRRQAMHLSGGSTSQRVVLTSHAWGHEGGNDLTITYENTGPGSELAVDVTGDDIVVTLATNGSGTVTSTAAQVVAAINADPSASALVFANTYRGNSGNGTVPAAGTESFDDGLSADPADVPREPFQVKALRIGKHRDGSRPGVLTYSQEHAREWQTPLVNIETASRLLHNYQTDGTTRQIVDNLDIFIIPTVNPDGALYSYNDFAFQRKNMTNYCEAGDPNDFNARNSWGVDNNRNYTVGSLFDGYDGASTSCTSPVFAGPSELSEPESANLYWVAETFEHIRFAMSIHSPGNYVMWSPGAYVVPGRETLPRPGLGTEQYFYSASEQILTAIQRWRSFTVTPARTGPIADVLYSAAGNSGDMLWYDFGIYAWNFEIGTGFQPEWDEAFDEMMEFSNGLIALYQVAMDWAADQQPPRSWLNQPGDGTYSGSVEVTFGTSEPADIYYTLDGSDPTCDSLLYASAGVREGGETIAIDATTTIKWFSIDASGNIERSCTFGTNGSNSEEIVITP